MRLFFAVLALSLPALGPTPAAAQPDRAAMMLRQMDADGDGRISREEWPRKPQGFRRMDTDQDGFLTLEELRARFGGGVGDGGPSGPPLDGQVPMAAVGADTVCAILRGRQCDNQQAVGRGLFETGLRAKFPDGLDCRAVDERWAMDYGFKRDRSVRHGGIDMPAGFGTPMLAAADGTVVSVINDPESYRGIELTLRHTPDQTGLPVYIYTQYAHLNEMPKVKVGEAVKMGQDLGPTGNSGKAGGKNARRPAIHFAVWYSDKPGFFASPRGIAPVDGWWMDPHALWRGAPPFDSASVRDLPDDRKDVAVAVITDKGEVLPAGARVIWPYACTRD